MHRLEHFKVRAVARRPTDHRRRLHSRACRRFELELNNATAHTTLASKIRTISAEQQRCSREYAATAWWMRLWRELLLLRKDCRMCR